MNGLSDLFGGAKQKARRKKTQPGTGQSQSINQIMGIPPRAGYDVARGISAPGPRAAWQPELTIPPLRAEAGPGVPDFLRQQAPMATETIEEFKPGTVLSPIIASLLKQGGKSMTPKDLGRVHGYGEPIASVGGEKDLSFAEWTALKRAGLSEAELSIGPTYTGPWRGAGASDPNLLTQTQPERRQAAKAARERELAVRKRRVAARADKQPITHPMAEIMEDMARGEEVSDQRLDAAYGEQYAMNRMKIEGDLKAKEMEAKAAATAAMFEAIGSGNLPADAGRDMLDMITGQFGGEPAPAEAPSPIMEGLDRQQQTKVSELIEAGDKEALERYLNINTSLPPEQKAALLEQVKPSGWQRWLYPEGAASRHPELARQMPWPFQLTQ